MSTTSTPGPSAPRLEEEHQYGSERGCDVVFLVGPSQDNCLRIPAHSHILKNTTPVFGAMFSDNFFSSSSEQQQSSLPSPLSEAKTASSKWENEGELIKPISVLDLDGKAFDNLMRYLYDSPLILQSSDTTIETLKAAHKYQCAGLVRNCVNYLVGLLSTNNVLPITANLAILCGDLQNLEDLYVQCKEKESGMYFFRIPQLLQRRRRSELNSEELNIELDCARLVYNCLDFIDRNATTVLRSEEIEDLDYLSIYHIMSRGTLLEQESLVFDAIVRWADKECKRRHFPLTQEKKRQVLQDLIYLPRYLRMTTNDFISGPAESDLFTREEVEMLSHLIQIGRDNELTPVSPKTCSYKRIESSGITISKSMRMHLNNFLKLRKTPDAKKNQGSGNSGPSDGNWKWVARLKKMRCSLFCCGRNGSMRPDRCTSLSTLSSQVRRGRESNHQSMLSISSGGGGAGAHRENYKPGCVGWTILIYAFFFD